MNRATEHSLPAFARMPETETVAAAVDLGGSWLFKATDEEEWLPAVVPGTVHTDLLRAGRLEDPYYRDNELKVQWVEAQGMGVPSVFSDRRGFPAARPDHPRLPRSGHDRRRLSERAASGPHLQYVHRARVRRQALAPAGENEIRIVFRSILAWNEERIAAEPRVTWDGAHGVDNEKGTSFFVRKCGADFGWDWGLRLLTCGVWRPLRLAAFRYGQDNGFTDQAGFEDPARAILHSARVSTGIAAVELPRTAGPACRGRSGRAVAPVAGEETSPVGRRAAPACGGRTAWAASRFTPSRPCSSRERRPSTSAGRASACAPWN